MEELTKIIQTLWQDEMLSKHAYAELLNFTNTHQDLQLLQTAVITSVYECKVCGKPYGDKLSLYEHYDSKHNQETE